MKKVTLTDETSGPIFTPLESENQSTKQTITSTTIDEETISKVFDKFRKKFTSLDFEVSETIDLKTS